MMVSTAPASRLDAMPRTRGTPEHRRPTGEATPTWESLARALDAAETVEEVVRVGQRVRAEVVAATRRTMVRSTTESATELAERIVGDGAGWPADDVATAMRCNVSFVTRARLAAGRDPETGLLPRDADPYELASELRAQGRSYRTIAALTGIPRSTLHDRLS